MICVPKLELGNEGAFTVVKGWNRITRWTVLLILLLLGFPSNIAEAESDFGKKGQAR